MEMYHKSQEYIEWLYEQDHLVRDIDQTDLHRFEPSSRTLLMDEHSYS